MFFSAWRVKIFLEDMIYNVSGLNASDTGTSSSNSIPDEIWATRVGVFAIGGTAIACFGLLCNSISIVVLANFRRKSSAPFLLICLEIVDSVLLLSEMILETLATLSQARLLSDSYRDFIRPVYVVTYPIPHIAQTGTTLLTVLITLERYVAVAKPLLASTVCSRAWARRAVLLIVLWSLVFHVPLYMAYTHDYQVHPRTNASKIVFHRTDFGRGHFYNYWFIVWINLVFEFLIPFVLIVVFNVLMLRALRASHSLTLSSGKGGNKRGGKLTGMVIAVTIIFFVCELFPAVALIIIRGKDAFAECSVACAHFVSVADTMVLLNSGVNFVAYCAIGKQFRDIFVKIFLRRAARAAGARPPPLVEKHSHSGGEDKVSEVQLHSWKEVTTTAASSTGGQNGHRFLPLHFHHQNHHHHHDHHHHHQNHQDHQDQDQNQHQTHHHQNHHHQNHHHQNHHHHHHRDSSCEEGRGRSPPPPTRL